MGAAIERLLELSPSEWHVLSEQRVAVWVSRRNWTEREIEIAHALFDRLATTPGAAWDRTACAYCEGYLITFQLGLLRKVCADRFAAKARGQTAGAIDKGHIALAEQALILEPLNDWQALLELAHESFHEQLQSLSARGFGTFDPAKASPGSVGTRSALLGWVKRCFGNRGARAGGKYARQRIGQRVHALRQEQAHADEVARLQRSIMNRELLQKVLRYPHLAKHDRYLQMLRYQVVEELTPDDAARRMNVSTKNGHVLSCRARQWLRKFVQNHRELFQEAEP